MRASSLATQSRKVTSRLTYPPCVMQNIALCSDQSHAQSLSGHVFAAFRANTIGRKHEEDVTTWLCLRLHDWALSDDAATLIRIVKLVGTRSRTRLGSGKSHAKKL